MLSLGLAGLLPACATLPACFEVNGELGCPNVSPCTVPGFEGGKSVSSSNAATIRRLNAAGVCTTVYDGGTALDGNKRMIHVGVAVPWVDFAGSR